MENDSWIVYMHRNKINKKVYIGITKCKNPNNRWRNGTHYENTYFGNAILKYGWNNFEHIILEKDITTIKEANLKEKYYISLYNSNNKNKGYNMTSGGDNFELNDMARANKSEIMKKRWEDPDYKEKVSERMKNYWDNHLEEKQRRGQSVKCIETGEIFHSYREAGEWCGLKQYKNSFLSYFRGEKQSCGKHPVTKSPLHWIKIDKNGKEILSNQNFEKKRKNGKKVKCLETQEIFPSLQDAVEWCGLSSSSSITNAIKGIRKSAGKHPITKEPLHWEYEN